MDVNPRAANRCGTPKHRRICRQALVPSAAPPRVVSIHPSVQRVATTKLARDPAPSAWPFSAEPGPLTLPEFGNDYGRASPTRRARTVHTSAQSATNYLKSINLRIPQQPVVFNGRSRDTNSIELPACYPAQWGTVKIEDYGASSARRRRCHVPDCVKHSQHVLM